MFHFVIIISIFFIGCSIANKSFQEDNIALINDSFFYGFGSGNTFIEAKENALKDLALNINVSIKYESNNSTSEENEILKMISNQKISIKSSIDSLSGIKIQHTNTLSSKHNVNIKISKLDLANEIEDSMIKSLNLINAKIYNSLNHLTLDKILFPSLKDIKQTKNEIKNLFSKHLILQSINNNLKYFKFHSSNSDLEYYLDHNVLRYLALILNQKPSYKLHFTFNISSNANVQNSNSELENVIKHELSKFINIDSNSLKRIEIELNKNNSTTINALFFNQDNVIEEIIKAEYNKEDSNNYMRIGAIFYKKIESVVNGD